MKHPIPSEALDDRLAIVGTAGSGKTYLTIGAMARLLERQSRVIGIDALGVMWGLRLMPDGKTASPFDIVIFGGPHGDLPLTENAGSIIGETVATMRESCILDLSQLGTKASERRFMLAFLTSLYRHANKEPVHLVVDEADMWAPQRLLDKDGDAAKLLGMMETIVRRGRVKGFIPWLVTQRPAVLSKDVLSQADGLIALKLTSKQDTDAVGGWIEATADRTTWQAIKSALPTKQRGEGVLWIPARGVLDDVTFPSNQTFDSSRTPKRGEKRQAAELRPIDLGKIKERLSTVEAETKASDPKALKAEIAALKRELKTVKPVAATPDHTALKVAEKAGFEAGYTAGYDGGWNDCIEKAKFVLEDLRDKTFKPAPAKRVPTPTVPITPPVHRAPVTPNDAPGITKPLQKILDAVAWWRCFGINEPTNTQVAFIAGYTPNAGAFNNYRGSLKSNGFVEYPSGGRIALTEAGIQQAAEPAGIPSEEELHDRVRDKLSAPIIKVLNPLIEAYPEAMTSADVADAAGYTAGTGAFNNYRGALRSLGIIDYPSSGMLRAEDWLFP